MRQLLCLFILALYAAFDAGCNEHVTESVAPPPEIASLIAVNGSNSVTLGWSLPPGGALASLEVHRSREDGFIPSSTTLYSAVPGSTKSFVDTAVTNGTLYYYRLVPIELLPDGGQRRGSPTDVTVGAPMDYNAVVVIQYSKHIQSIFNSGCAVGGCHVGPTGAVAHRNGVGTSILKALHGNEQFALRSWEDVVQGGPHGALVVAFKSPKSHLVFHMNNDTLVAPVSLPHMPLPGVNLPAVQLQTIMRWIDEGAQNDVGAIPFTVDPNGKVLVTNQAEDLVAVIDLSTNLVARYVQAGVPNVLVQPPNAPHNVTVDKAHGYYYVNLVVAGKVLKYRLNDNILVGEVSGIVSPTQVALSAGGDTGYVAQFASGTHAIRMFDTQTMLLLPLQISSQYLNKPHGVQLTPDKREVWVTGNFSDNILVVTVSDNSTTLIPLVPNDTLPPGTGNRLLPYQTVMTSDNKFVYVSCSQSNEVRVIDRDSMAVVSVVPVGRWPLILAVSPDNRYVYSTNRNSNDVSVIRTSDNTVVATVPNVGPGPHGIDVTADGRYAYVSCENVTSVVPPHHPTSGSKVPGYVSVIDLSTNQVVKQIEVGAFAAGVAVVQ